MVMRTIDSSVSGYAASKGWQIVDPPFGLLLCALHMNNSMFNGDTCHAIL
jgi:hypothetical protein